MTALEQAAQLAEEARQKHAEKQEGINDVRNRYSHIKFPNVYTRPASFRDGNKVIDVDGRVAIVGETVELQLNKETQTVALMTPITPFYAFASSQYKIAPHEEAILGLEGMLEELNGSYTDIAPIIEPAVFNQGAKMTVNVRFPSAEYPVGPNQEKVQVMVEMRNSYDLGWEFMIRFKAWQKVCSNGMYGMKEMQRISKKHRQNLDTGTLVKEVSTYMDRFSEQVGIWDRWAQKKLTENGIGEIFEALEFSEKRIEEVKMLPMTGRSESMDSLSKKDDLTLWDVNSAITQFITHEIESDLVRIDMGEKTANVLQKSFEK
ncbi:hypothetical protein LCGC14_1605330 [marine sediment metagenome]|uniref:DUF932 domain-containing protein n=1 Tax=marine sediment metagenome TaxID=412755 RepID=A0A0F9I9X5_9ZZZZ